MKTEFIKHVNKWWWGTTINIVTTNGHAMVELQFDDNYPTIAFVKGLIVYAPFRRNGLGTALLNECHEIARNKGYSYLQLSANKNEIWLWEWYQRRFGFEVIMKDDHEYTMLKSL